MRLPWLRQLIPIRGHLPSLMQRELIAIYGGARCTSLPILGSGPVGCTKALYAARANIREVLVSGLARLKVRS
jgi:hypothetical protein